ncbi:MAG: hypothetical protein JXB05_35535 [Myxococcaceae bacterium]|nr:hypothetical protein [Myxococcaceae bacterium]
MFFGHPDAHGFTPRRLAPLRALARYVGRGLHEILEWERWHARWGPGLTALVGEMSDAVMIVQCSPSGRVELLATSPAATRVLSLRDRGESRNLELRELLGSSLEAAGPAGQPILWTARSDTRFEVKANALPSCGGSTLMIRLVPREPMPMHDERPLLGLAREAGLTAREASILDALSRGRSHKEVAAELGIAYFTVTTHVRNLFSKLGVNSSPRW